MKGKLNKLRNSVNNFFCEKSFLLNFLIPVGNAVPGGVGEEFLGREVSPLIFTFSKPSATVLYSINSGSVTVSVC